MKIRMLSSFVGKAGACYAGEEIDVKASLATRLIERGNAVPVREPDIERAVIGATEKAVKRRGKRNVEPS